MKTAFLRGGAILLALGASACASRGGSDGSAHGGVDVARFHLGQPIIAKAQIAIEPFDRADSARPGYPAVAAAVARELTRLGWTIAPAGSGSEQIALIDIEQGSRESIAALTSARIGRGLAPPQATGSSAGITATLLEVGLRRRSDATVFWEGRAVVEAPTGSAEAEPTAAAARLAPALFQDFPGESGRTIRIR
ncbi:hypothetical protein [Sphingosinicella sp. BN140058]|uniref:hypothetical protein n=1 Tax=Sphingosinicella sp. BN140058 TaxID=1892855 RepID=UPI001011574F|nr:hypothetical protein [Sphingosinicella sp. BN140058]QAY77116.1 hypothetical protein ETR14_11840 [Sphingosinicella sp. BN140058]